MSDTPQGEGWWEASDGNWYPPEQHPNHPAESSSTPAPMNGPPRTTALEPLSWVAIGGIAAAVLGSFLPWAQAGIFSVNGTDGDGSLTLVAGAIAGACYGYYVKQPATRNGPRIAALVLMVIAAAIYVYDLVDVASMVDDDFIEVAPGSGLYIGTLGSIAAVVAMAMELARQRRSKSD